MSGEDTTTTTTNSSHDDDNANKNKVANIAIVGAGWWSQGWHLPALSSNNLCRIVAIVDISEQPKSNLNPNLLSLKELGIKYNTKTFTTIQDMFEQLKVEVNKNIDGVIIATPHSTHYEIAKQIITTHNKSIINIMMEKPMTTHIGHAIDLYKLLCLQQQQQNGGKGQQFWINHSANYRPVVTKIKNSVTKIGQIQHIHASFASPLKWIFDDPSLDGWNLPQEGMIGNGFAWGQSSHIFAYLYHIMPNIQPFEVYCSMTYSTKTNADVSHSATIRCIDTNNSSVVTEGEEEEEEIDNNNNNNNNNIIVMNITGTTLLPGNAHSDPPIPKLIQIDIFGSEGSLHYGGNDRDPTSGQLTLRQSNNGQVVVLDNQFVFENLDNIGKGPESIQKFITLCCRRHNGDDDNSDDDNHNINDDCGANIMDGLRSIQTIDAMYRSSQSNQVEPIIMP